MGFATSAFGTAAFSVEGGSTSPYLSAVATAAGAATASAVGLAVLPVYSLDPYWGQVVFLSHFDQTFGGDYNKIIDEAGHTVGATGGVGLVINQIPYGPSHRECVQAGTGIDQSIYIDGLSNEFNGFTLSDNWTVEFQTMGASQSYPIHIQGNNTNSQMFVEVVQVGGDYCVVVQPQGASSAYQSSAVAMPALTWQTIVVECFGGAIHVAVNGTSLSIGADTTSSVNTNPSSNCLTLFSHHKGGFGYGAVIDEMRVTKAARYNGSGYPAAYGRFPDARYGRGWEAVFSAVGEAVTSFVGEEAAFVSVRAGIATSAGSSSTWMRARRIVPAAAQAAGSSIASGVSPAVVVPETTISADAHAAGGSAAVGVGRAIVRATATGAGNSAVSFFAGYMQEAQGASAGGSLAAATGRAVSAASFYAVGLSSASASTVAIAQASGVADGDATAYGVPPGIQKPLTGFCMSRVSKEFVTTRPERAYV